MAFKSGSPGQYQITRHGLQRAISKLKSQFRVRVEATSDALQLWQGLQDITPYKAITNSMNSSDVSLPDELNAFYARNERENTPTAVKLPAAPDEPVNSARLLLRTVNTRKAKGPDGIPSKALKTCANQLAGVFKDIFTTMGRSSHLL